MGIELFSNGGKFVTAFQNIEKTSYIAVVCACVKDDSVELSSYQCC